jgi:hypothetical protein
MTDKPHVTMTPDELVIELLTTGQSLTGGRDEAERLLWQVKDRHAHRLAEEIREETAALKAHGVLEPDHYRPCRDAASQIDPEETR